MFTRDRICLDLFGIGSTMVQMHSVYTGPVRNWNGTVPYGITFISGPFWYQIVDLILTRSSKSRVNTKFIRTNFVPVPNGSSSVLKKLERNTSVLLLSAFLCEHLSKKCKNEQKNELWNFNNCCPNLNF